MDEALLERREVPAVAGVFNAVLRRSGRLARVPPNLVTAACGVCALLATFAFCIDAVSVGAMLYAIAAIGDGFDGALARYQERQHREGRLDLVRNRSQWFQRGETPLGTKLDPFIDKLSFYGALLPLGMGALPGPAIAVSVLTALALTGLRPFARWRWRLELPSNIWGKIKVQFERATIGCLVFLGAAPIMRIVLAGVFSTATLFGLRSLIGQVASLFRKLKSRSSTI